MLRLLLDENFNHDILRGLKLRSPNLDFVVAQDTELQGAKDPPLLEWASEQNRILVTHDLETIPKFAYDRVKAGLSMPGVIAISQDVSIGLAIEDLMIAVE
jgi:hypothetical protein